MRISIIGPSGSGKTYLAGKLSKQLGIEHTNLDYVFYKHVKDKGRIELPEEEWRKKLKTLLQKNSWIIEGVNPLIEVFDAADKIIYIRPFLALTLYSQWKRYCTDPKQRKEHGFINNLKLSRYLFKQYFQVPDTKELNNPKYSRVRKIDKIVEDYKDKLLLFRSRGEVNKLIKNSPLALD